jgi:hypothetical protein
MSPSKTKGNKEISEKTGHNPLSTDNLLLL